jgi:hypothetical protein
MITISILRYRLYEIDVLINRALVYDSLRAIIYGLSIALLGFLQRQALAYTGQKSEAATVIVTLMVATGISPIKNWIQAKVDWSSRKSRTPGKGSPI